MHYTKYKYQVTVFVIIAVSKILIFLFFLLQAAIWGLIIHYNQIISHRLLQLCIAL